MKILTAVLIVFSTPAFACEIGERLPHTRAALPTPHILAIGSSSTAGVGAGKKTTAYPAQIIPAFDGSPIKPNVVARGIGGEKAAGALTRMGREIADTNPDLVLWQVGTNDANARLKPADVAETIRTGVALIRASGADAILIDPQYYPRIASKPHYEEMAEMIDTVGVELCIPVIDRFEEMRAAGDDLPTLLAEDNFHMSVLGHRLLAESIAREIKCTLSKECGHELE